MSIIGEALGTVERARRGRGRVGCAAPDRIVCIGARSAGAWRPGCRLGTGALVGA